MVNNNCVHVYHLTFSRIEWVWLHWCEYLKAIEEFEAWLIKHQRNLDMRIELQLGLKEKLWQVDQQKVALSDIHGQAGLLERLLDEAAALYNRTQDPAVEAQAQERLQEAYNDVRDKAEVRTARIFIFLLPFLPELIHNTFLLPAAWGHERSLHTLQHSLSNMSHKHAHAVWGQRLQDRTCD